MTTMRLILNDIDGEQVRTETFDGDEYLVAPVTLIRSQNLHRGYVPEEEVLRSAPAWNGIPITLNHPTNAQGEHVSANSPDVAEKTWLGYIFNAKPTTVNGKAAVEGEAWYKIEKARALGGEVEGIVNDLRAGETVSVSSSYFGDPLPAGNYDGEHREQVRGHIKPDHVATLPNEKGKCSIEDGCGVGQVAANEESELLVNATADDPDESANCADPMGEDCGCSDCMEETFNALSQARTPTFEGTTSGEWSSPTFNDYLSANGWEADSVEDLTEEQRQAIANRSLLGDPEAETFDELQVFPVVDPSSGNLSENALDAVLSGRGAQADIPDSALESARNRARSLLEAEFDRDLSENAMTLLERAQRLLGIDIELNAEAVPSEDAEAADADGNDDGPQNMDARVNELVENHGFDADELPDEDTESFDRIYNKFVGDEDTETGEEQTEQTTNEENEDGESAETESVSAEQIANELSEQFVTEDELADAVGEALAQNREREQKEDLVNDIVANSDDHTEEDREELLDSPKSVLESLASNLDTGSADWSATRTSPPSVNDGEDGSDMPALSAQERIAELESDD